MNFKTPFKDVGTCSACGLHGTPFFISSKMFWWPSPGLIDYFYSSPFVRGSALRMEGPSLHGIHLIQSSLLTQELGQGNNLSPTGLAGLHLTSHYRLASEEDVMPLAKPSNGDDENEPNATIPPNYEIRRP
ncbi:hypothetical protein VNO77_22700 [Canavalia gladiata]|uniref:Uncharacterized protein n=1 Tax=Canavalia gladiata TaxID=3824 RepID=A0AAN9L6C0_CANGL